MLLILIPLICLIISLIAIKSKNICYCDRWYDFMPFLSGIVLSFVVFFNGIVYSNTLTQIVEFKAAKQTIESMRSSSDNLERIAAYSKIAEWNSWLASTQYWDDSIWVDSFYPDAVRELTPISVR